MTIIASTPVPEHLRLDRFTTQRLHNHAEVRTALQTPNRKDCPPWCERECTDEDPFGDGVVVHIRDRVLPATGAGSNSTMYVSIEALEYPGQAPQPAVVTVGGDGTLTPDEALRFAAEVVLAARTAQLGSAL